MPPLTVLDFRLNYKNRPFGAVIGKERMLAWPVGMYRVTLPVWDGHSNVPANPFERLILALLATDSFVADSVSCDKTLALETCLPIDLVRCVLMKLRDRGYLDENNRVTQNGDEYFREKEEPQHTTAVIFRELVTGRILPNMRPVDNQHQIAKRMVGERENMTALRWEKEFLEKIPTPKDVIRTVRLMAKRLAQYGISVWMPVANQINIQKTAPELFYMQCPIAIQMSDAEYRIADPFGHGCSALLEQAFYEKIVEDEKLGKWLMNWKKQLIQTASSDSGFSQKAAPFEKSYKHYPKLIAQLRTTLKKPFRSTVQIYSALEWALFYYCDQRDFSVPLQQLEGLSAEQQERFLKKTAKSMGFDVTDYQFASVPPGKLRSFKDGTAEMNVVLALALMLADFNHQEDRIHLISQACPDFFKRLKTLKTHRDRQLHGGKKEKLDAPRDEDPWMCQMVHILLPEVAFDEEEQAVVDKIGISDDTLVARTRIQQEFTLEIFSRMSENLQLLLISAEQSFLSSDELRFSWFVNDITAAIQTLLVDKCSMQLPLNLTEERFRAAAAEKARNAGWEKIPDRICTCRLGMVRNALQGNGATLGACVMAFLILADEDVLDQLFDQCPTFLEDIVNMLVKREHGNDVIKMLEEECNQFRKRSYTIVKSLMEV